ncbi:hypothetical protein Bca4012_061978 [Brassica carinata]
MLQEDLPLAIYDKNSETKMGKMKVEDWNEIEVWSISEILVAFEVLFWAVLTFHNAALGNNMINIDLYLYYYLDWELRSVSMFDDAVRKTKSSSKISFVLNDKKIV